MPVITTYPSLTAVPGLLHGVTGRRGGQSLPPFASLNLGLHVGDDPASVLANRAAAMTALGASLDDLVLAQQVHGPRIAQVGREAAGRGARDLASAIPGADALITAEPGLVLGTLVADCAPVLLVDPGGRGLGLAHAGWRGTVAGIAAATVSAMRDAFGSDPARMLAVVGPSVGREDFEVGPEVAGAFRRAFGAAAEDWIDAGVGDRSFFDLPAANRHQLERAGLDPARIAIDPRSTATHTEALFSHRAEGGRTGRFGAFLGWRRLL